MTRKMKTDIQAAENAKFIAWAGNLRAGGRTTGEVLDALASKWGDITRTVPVIVQHFGPDRFFTQAQYDRMQELRTRIGTLSTKELTELNSLNDAELDATVARLDALAPSAANTSNP